MKYVWLLPLMLAGCSSVPDKPASDVSGAGFIMLTPNAASRQHMLANDRTLAEQIAVNRSACERAVLCRK